MKRKKAHEGSGHGGSWIITFADLVSLLMAFFVMIVSFSNQDEQKRAQAAGSVREAFGIVPVDRFAGVIELDGLPVREHAKDIGQVSDRPHGDGEITTTFNRIFGDSDIDDGANRLGDGEFSDTAIALQEALRQDTEFGDLFEVAILKHDREGLSIEIADQEGRSMFDVGSVGMNRFAVAVFRQIAPVLDKLPNRVRIVGHTSSEPGETAGAGSKWLLSAQRAEAARDALSGFGLSADRFARIVGAGDTDPLFPEDSFLPGNRRVTILVEPASPPLPPALRR